MNEINENIKSGARAGNKLIIFGVILGICLIIAAGIGSFTFYWVRSQKTDTLTVTGSVKKEVTSDLAKWTSTFQRNVPIDSLKDGYTQMANDQQAVLKFFKDQGVDVSKVLISPVFMENPSKYDPNAPKEYILTQNVEIQSNDVNKITSMAKNTQVLIEEGVIFSTNTLEYYYTKLPDLRISLLSDAAADAKKRAQKIAESTGLVVGSIKSANAGVVQVLRVNSNEISDYGTYDTSTIEKEVMVTVTAIFNLK
ncbi:MAG: SIMPL domain-containing protein [Actinobacteria bacterium]|nr:SIMPL domain-containing protein [Actinomycetota bacterium]